MQNPDQRPELRRQAAAVRTQVNARPQDYLGALPAGNSELEGLVKGLAQFNPSLHRYAIQRMEDKRDEDDRQGTAIGDANGQRVERPRDALTQETAEPSLPVSPAFDRAYQRSYSQALAGRVAIESQADLVERYSQEKDTDGFNVDQFLTQARAGALQGIQDPHAVAIIGKRMSEAEASIRAQHQQAAVRKHEDDRLATASRLADDFTAAMTPEQIADHHFGQYVPQMRSIQVDPKQAAGLLLNRVKALSDQAGGRPDLFDAFGQKDTEGFTILDRNPQLADHIAQARDQAIRQRDTALQVRKQPAVARVLMEYADDVQKMPERVTQERLTSDVASGTFTAEKASGLWHEAQVELGKKRALSGMVGAAEKGMLGRYEPSDQKKVLDQLLGPTVDALWEAATSGNQGKAQALAQVVMQRQSSAGATVPVESLQRLMQTTVSNQPSPDGPSPKFLASAEIYKALAADPKYRSLYFKEDTDEVMGGFVKNIEGGADAKTAYTAAYRTVDPEFKALARKRAEAPEMQEKIRSIATKYATGSTMWGWLGGNGRPENQQMLGTWAAGMVRRELELNPDLTDKELQDHIERQAAENFVLDSTSQLAVKVPPSLSGDLTQQALSAYSKSWADTLTARGQFPDGSVIRYVPLNGEGLYQVQAWTGSRQKALGEVQLGDVINRHRAATTLSREEGAALVDLRIAAQTGQPLPQVDPALIAKGRSVGLFNERELKEIERANREQILARFKAVPDFGYGKPVNLAAPMPQKPNATIDAKTTSRLSLELAGVGAPGWSWESVTKPGSGIEKSHMGLAGSLIALREGVSLTAYRDPNPDAGMNIGAGYNLKANATTANADLKRAGVPEDRIEDVKTGKASMTPEQVKRLITNVVPRYEEQTRKVAESTAPGLWQKMTPQQRAVMVDIAYQTGDAAQFRKAWGYLAAGDSKAFADETRVFYKNKAGDRVEDTRARELRASMLAGIPDWEARVSLAAER